MFCIETHTHTSEHSACSIMTAADLIRRAVEIGLDGLIVSDHHYAWPEADLREIARSVGAERLLVLATQEITARDEETGEHQGDYLLYGYNEPLPQPMSAEQVVEAGRAHGALVIVAHPFRHGMGAGDRVFDLPVDGIEVYNQNHSPEDVRRCSRAVAECGFLGIAGSDAHRVEQVGQFLTCLERPIASMEEFIGELRARRFTLKSTRPDMPISAG